MIGRPAPMVCAVLVVALLATAIASGACEDLLQEPESGKLTPPVQLQAVSGDDQSGMVGRTLAASLRVRMVDAEGRPLSRMRVEWSPAPGSGRAEPRNSFTDADGVAGTTWTLGSGNGAQELRAGLGSAAPVLFHATATP